MPSRNPVSFWRTSESATFMAHVQASHCFLAMVVAPQAELSREKAAYMGATAMNQTNGSPVVECNPRFSGTAQLGDAATT